MKLYEVEYMDRILNDPWDQISVKFGRKKRDEVRRQFDNFLIMDPEEYMWSFEEAVNATAEEMMETVK